MSNATLTELRSGIETARQTLAVAAWCAMWSTAEPQIQQARDELATALALVLMIPDPDDEIEVLATAGNVALQVLLACIDTAAQYLASCEAPTVACRRLVTEALTTLGEALDHQE
jgi:hypothetical protein